MLPPRADDVRRLIIHILNETLPGNHWDQLVGPIIAMSALASPSGNWMVTPRGNERQRDAIKRATAIVRQKHQFILMS
jgi:hypothetical protein